MNDPKNKKEIEQIIKILTPIIANRFVSVLSKNIAGEVIK